MFREETLNKVDRRTYEEPDGEFLELIETGNNTVTVLTRIDSDKVGGVEPPFNPEEYNVSELKDVLEQYALTQEEYQALIEAEREGKNRKTAVQYLEEQ